MPVADRVSLACGNASLYVSKSAIALVLLVSHSQRLKAASGRQQRLLRDLCRRRHVREERAESLRHRRVRENGVAETRIWQVRQHCRLHRGHDLTGLGADHREADDAVVTRPDKSLHEALCFVCCLRPQYSARRKPRYARRDALALRFAFAQAHASEWRLREHAVWNQPIARGALPSGQIVPDDPKVVDGYVREVRGTGAFPYSPDTGRCRLQPVIDMNVATTVQLDAGVLDTDARGVWNAPGRHQDVAALDLLLTEGRAHGGADSLSGSAMHTEGLGRQEKLNTFATENPLHFTRDVR